MIVKNFFITVPVTDRGTRLAVDKGCLIALMNSLPLRRPIDENVIIEQIDRTTDRDWPILPLRELVRDSRH